MVNSISPSTGPVSGGTVVIINGAFLSGATAVTFVGVNATSFTVLSSLQISAVAPPGVAGAAGVQVTKPDDTTFISANDYFTYIAIAPPTITLISPTSGRQAGRTTVTIPGTGFTGATAVKFGGTNTKAFTVNSATSNTATAPAGVSGTVDVTVTTSGGTSATSAADQFTYIAPPVLTMAFSPTTVFVGDPSVLTITVTNPYAMTADVSLDIVIPAGLFFQPTGAQNCAFAKVDPIFVVVASGATCVITSTVTADSIGLKTVTAQANNDKGEVSNAASATRERGRKHLCGKG